MNTTLNTHLAAVLIAERHAVAARRRLARVASSVSHPAEIAEPTSARRRLRLRRVTA